MNVRTQNILTIAVAVLFFVGFIVWAEGIGGDDHDNRLEANATTTTFTLPRVTTSQPPATFEVPSTVVTVAPFISPPSSAPRTTATTRRTTGTTARTTATTRRTTATTRSTTATTIASGPNGRSTEAADNSAAFTHNSDGTTSESATPVSATPGALVFKITSKVLSASGSSAQVRLTVDLTNDRGRPITFPDGLRITLQITPSNGSPFALVLDAHEVTGLNTNETVTAATTAPIEGFGTFNVNGSVEVDFGS